MGRRASFAVARSACCCLTECSDGRQLDDVFRQRRYISDLNSQLCLGGDRV